MEEFPSSHILNQRVPYTKLNKNGKFLGVNNKFLYKADGKYFEEGVEISLNQYEEWSHIPTNKITDAILNKFFE